MSATSSANNIQSNGQPFNDEDKGNNEDEDVDKEDETSDEDDNGMQYETKNK